MRLWHYKLIPYLPNSQLIAQWRELNSIFKNQPKHILINYVYRYPKVELFIYSTLVMNEMRARNINIKSIDNICEYFKHKNLRDVVENNIKNNNKIFKKHHNNRYLIQCFYNLQEKYDRGQKDFSKEQYKKLEQFISEEVI